jgi:HAD superfamily hydrolase (TIGR01662 family)
MAAAYTGIFFDLGSTLIYFNGDWEDVFTRSDQAVAAVITEAGYKLESLDFPALFRQQLRAYHDTRDQDLIEHTTLKILRNFLAEIGLPEMPDEVLNRAMTEMYAVSQAHWHPEEDALATLEQLHQNGYKIGVISNAANHQDVSTLVDQSGFRHTLDFVLTSAKNGMRKPSPRIFQQALDNWGVHPSKVLMVGDLLRPDIAGAQQMGIYSVWITRRADNAENALYADQITPDATIATLNELPELIRRLETGKQ